MRKIQGFTLVEMVLTIALVGILFAATSIILRQGLDSYENVQTRGTTLQDARYGMERVFKELLRVGDEAGNTVSGISNNQVTFVNAVGDTTNFQWDGQNLVLGNDTQMTSNILLNNVTALAFTGYDQNNNATEVAASVRRIHVSLSVLPTGHETPIAFQTDIFLRNHMYENFR